MDIEEFKKWHAVFKKECNVFIVELCAEIKKFEYKSVPIQEIQEVSPYQKRLIIDSFENHIHALIDACNTLDLRFTEVMDIDCISKKMADINAAIEVVTFELKSISIMIKENLFQTKLEKFLLVIQQLTFKINNFVTGKGYARYAASNDKIIILNLGSYASPKVTLPGQPFKMIFTANQIKQEAKQACDYACFRAKG